MKTTVNDLKQKLLEEYTEIMLMALQEKGGVYFLDSEYYKIREKIYDAIRDSIRI